MYVYRDENDRQVSVDSLDELVEAARRGELTTQCTIFDSGRHDFIPATASPLFAAVSRLAREADENDRIAASPPSDVGSSDAKMVVCPNCQAENRLPVGTCFSCGTFLDRVLPVPNPRYGTVTNPSTPRRVSATHGILGKVYIFFLYVGSVLWTLAGIVVIGISLANVEWLGILIGTGFLLLAAASYYLAQGLGQFRGWARIAVLLVLYLSIVGSLETLLRPEGVADAIGAGFSLLLQSAFAYYFHTRKDQFASEGDGRRIAVF